MRKRRVLLDVDGVLGDFLGHSFPVLEKLTGRKWAYADFQTWDIFDTVSREYERAFFDEINQPGWCQSIPVFSGSQDGVRRLMEISDLYVVTSPMNHVPTWMYEREQWLLKHFGIPHKRVVHTSAKYLCLGDVLIDDRPANIEAWEKEHLGGRGFLWHQTYNRASTVGKRVLSWDQTIEALQGR